MSGEDGGVLRSSLWELMLLRRVDPRLLDSVGLSATGAACVTGAASPASLMERPPSERPLDLRVNMAGVIEPVLMLVALALGSILPWLRVRRYLLQRRVDLP